MLPEPYESVTVFPAPSGIPCAGEGLFAKRDLKAGELAAIFSGLRCYKTFTMGTTIKYGTDEEWSDYRITLGEYVWTT